MRHNFQNYMRNKITILCQSEHAKIPPHPKHTHIKKQFLFMETPYMDLRAGSTRKVVCLTCPVSSRQSIRAPPRRDRGCQNTCIDVPLAYICRGALSREQWRLALSKLEKNMLQRTRRIGPAWAVSYFTDQLMTPYSKYFSGGSTINGTPGRDRRVLGGQIGRLSLPLHRVDATALDLRNEK